MKKIFIDSFVYFLTIILLCVAADFSARAYLWSKKNLPSILDEELLKLTKSENVSKDTFNIYYFGGSSMKGSPYYPQMSIPKIVDYMLGHRVNGKEIRTVNVARSGYDFQYNLKRLKRIVMRKDVFYPSLCVIYSGHNEFLKFNQNYDFRIFSRFIRVPIWLIRHSIIVEWMAEKLELYAFDMEERDLFDKPLFGENGYKNVVQKYKQEIKEAVDLLHKNKIPVIISTVAGNYSDFEPNRSIFCPGSKGKSFFKQLMQDGQKAEKEYKFEEAVKSYKQALQICGSFAEAHYRIGKSYEALGNFDAAWEHYSKAVNYDGMPIRALQEQNEFIKSLDNSDSIYAVDAVNYLRQHAENGLIGFNLMIDGDHPNQKGYLLIGELIAAKIQNIFSPKLNKLNYIDIDKLMMIFNIDENKLFEINLATGRWFTRISTLRYDPAERLRLAEYFILNALRLEPERYEPYLGLAMINFLKKNVSEARVYLKKAKIINANEVNIYISQHWVKNVISYSERK